MRTIVLSELDEESSTHGTYIFADHQIFNRNAPMEINFITARNSFSYTF